MKTKLLKHRKVLISLICMFALIILFIIFKKQLGNLILNDDERYIRSCIYKIEEDCDKSISIEDVKYYKYAFIDSGNSTSMVTMTYLDLYLSDNIVAECNGGYEGNNIDDLDYNFYTYYGDPIDLDKYGLLKVGLSGEYVEGTEDASYEICRDITSLKKEKRERYKNCNKQNNFSLWKIKLFS